MHPLFRIVSWKNKYNIEFKGLKEGLHEYEYKVDDKFFEHFNESLVKNGDITVKAKLEKRSAFLKLHFTISGCLEPICDRCLDEYQQDVEHYPAGADQSQEPPYQNALPEYFHLP